MQCQECNKEIIKLNISPNRKYCNDCSKKVKNKKTIKIINNKRFNEKIDHLRSKDPENYIFNLKKLLDEKIKKDENNYDFIHPKYGKHMIDEHEQTRVIVREELKKIVDEMFKKQKRRTPSPK